MECLITDEHAFRSPGSLYPTHVCNVTRRRLVGGALPRYGVPRTAERYRELTFGKCCDAHSPGFGGSIIEANIEARSEGCGHHETNGHPSGLTETDCANDSFFKVVRAIRDRDRIQMGLSILWISREGNLVTPLGDPGVRVIAF